ncbi:MAG: helix-turn-helix domain-containing protein, partial [Verrucomicrobiota bacterium]
SERIGFEAAAMLDDLMRGKTVKDRVTLIPPLRVVSRQSTDILAIRDQALVKAMRFIHENAEKQIDVKAVAGLAGISRRSLELRFREVLGHTPADHIRRTRVEVAKRLLIDTDLSIADVAEQSGFGNAEYMATLFKKEVAITPLRYRRDSRLGLP